MRKGRERAGRSQQSAAWRSRRKVCYFRPGLSRHLHPPLTGLGTPSESRGLIPPTR
ncbi:unnamed protein product [Rangifer tarandus platyrhynchus]|uniref:Uncharacterized protein n=1 Tax=Rangifer tarandus platyrhynchus TaxID=3082113 RepID=A0AC59Y1K3_RANTA